MFFGWLRSERRRRLTSAPFPPAWREILRRNVAVAAYLSPTQRERLERTTQILVAERGWSAARGVSVSDEMRVTIAAQAALLVLGVEGYYFERLPPIVLRADRFQDDRRREGGLVDEGQEMLGQARTHDMILLSWPDVLAGGRDPADGHNLVLHELAHHLDNLGANPDGTPPYTTRPALERYKSAAAEAQQKLHQQVYRGEPTVLYPYALENAAEFFAVATETFYERPIDLDREFPALFESLRELYQLDPRIWFGGGVSRPEERYDPDGEEEDEAEAEIAVDSLQPLRTANEHFTRGLEYFERGEWAWAAHDFSAVLRKSPDDVEALRYRAIAYFTLGKVQKAERDVRAALAIEPNDLDAIQILAALLVNRGEYAKALPLLDRVIAEQPDQLDARFDRAKAAAELGDKRRALADVDAILHLDPDDRDARSLRDELAR